MMWPLLSATGLVLCNTSVRSTNDAADRYWQGERHCGEVIESTRHGKTLATLSELRQTNRELGEHS